MPKGHEKEVSRTPSDSTNESARESRDISNILQILDSQPVKTNPFGANITGENSYRRAERISAALHLVTNHVPENEPVRSAIRESGLKLLTQILELRASFRSPASEKGQSALATIRELVSLVRLLAISGYVSAQNVNAVAEALDELGSLIVVSQRSTLAEQLTISREDLTPSTHQISLRTDTAVRRQASVRQKRSAKDIRDNGENETQGDAARSERIMDILKMGGVLGIKDITSNLPQYSEKMVQRELAELVRVQKVRKIGSKRWSRYQIVP